jgi:hypothetical protein
MEYGYDTQLGPLLARRVTDWHVPATADEQALWSSWTGNRIPDLRKISARRRSRAPAQRSAPPQRGCRERRRA